jgi:malate dehydrogenase (oxaloacetate-decarboxylating)
MLFKYLGGVDAIPIGLDTKDPYQIILTVRLLQPSFGGINLEDISQPKCFRVLDMLRSDPEIRIPVWHDDQQGTATVLLAAVFNALKIIGKKIEDIKVSLIGSGAANVATLRLLVASGVKWANIYACDSHGLLHPGRKDIEARKIEYVDKWRICQKSNGEGRVGGPAEAMRGTDVCIALSKPGPGTILPEWVAAMNQDAIIFPAANPIPEIWPWEAKGAGARVVGTGRSDFPNQVNNSLVFPAIFRGVLDVRATTITDQMAIAAAQEIALFAEERGIDEDNIMPTMDEWELFPREAVAVALKAQEQGVAHLDVGRDQLYHMAEAKICQAREMIQMLMDQKIIPPPPPEVS